MPLGASQSPTLRAKNTDPFALIMSESSTCLGVAYVKQVTSLISDSSPLRVFQRDKVSSFNATGTVDVKILIRKLDRRRITPIRDI